ncbi:H-type lectin domain-containing protein [Geomonas edaphica]|uniref:H-type lectin domain-containing protein n=1 Tax=Geomonas edaphica TaxID=2570226 RepID=UPI0010A932EC|nr:H-type lectin domain-containing protein [Geomonas edaphica]
MEIISSKNILPENFVHAAKDNITESQELPNGLRIESGAVGFGQTAVRFTTPFSTAPTVVMGITGFDLDHGANLRLGCGPMTNSVTRDGFTATLGTWANTGVYSASAFWMAIGK